MDFFGNSQRQGNPKGTQPHGNNMKQGKIDLPADFLSIGNPITPEVPQGLIGVQEKLLKAFPPELNIAASTTVNLQAGVDPVLPMGTRGFLIFNLVGTVAYSVNGGGGRTAFDKMTIDGAAISSLSIVTAAGASCTLQAWGYGS